MPTAVLFMIGVIGMVSSFFNDIFQFNHLLAIVSFIVIISAAYGLWIYCQRNGISVNEMLVVVLLVIVFNSVIIILELNFDSFRQFIESFLDPFKGGGINYASGYRLRGVSSAGGAGLSISIPVALTIALHLFDRKILPFYLFIPIAAILLFSILVIGRTGLVLSVLPFTIYMILLLKRGRVIFLLTIWLTLPLLLRLLYQFTTGYFTDMFGENFIMYAIGFLLEGSEGIEKERTIGYIIDFLKVLPLEFPQAFVGYGFYGGSAFVPWTDSGFARMFMSVGFVFGLIFYMLIYRVYFLAFKSNEFLIGVMILLLTVAEIKEPLLFSGVASRIFITVLVFFWLEKYSLLKRNGKGCGLLLNSDGRSRTPSSSS